MATINDKIHVEEVENNIVDVSIGSTNEKFRYYLKPSESHVKIGRVQEFMNSEEFKDSLIIFDPPWSLAGQDPQRGPRLPYST